MPELSVSAPLPDSLACLTADQLAQIFGFRLHKRLRGKLQTVLEKLDHGHHVLRAYGKSSFLRMYEKFATFLRLEAGSNRVQDFGLHKGLETLEAVRRQWAAVTERFAGFQAQALHVHVDLPLLQRLALPVLCGHTKIAGIKIQRHSLFRSER